MQLTAQKQAGATLIELILFIIIIGIVTSGVSASLLTGVFAHKQIRDKQQATEYAQMRISLIQGQKILHGFSSFDDPCDSSPSLDVCSSGDYTITSSINSWHDNGWPGDSTHYKKITVTADDSEGDQLAEMTTIVTDSPPN